MRLNIMKSINIMKSSPGIPVIIMCYNH